MLEKKEIISWRGGGGWRAKISLIFLLKNLYIKKIWRNKLLNELNFLFYTFNLSTVITFYLNGRQFSIHIEKALYMQNHLRRLTFVHLNKCAPIHRIISLQKLITRSEYFILNSIYIHSRYWFFKALVKIDIQCRGRYWLFEGFPNF